MLSPLWSQARRLAWEGSGKEGCRGQAWVDSLWPPVLATWGQQRPVPMVCEGMVISRRVATFVHGFGTHGLWVLLPDAGRRTGGTLREVEIIALGSPCCCPL